MRELFVTPQFEKDVEHVPAKVKERADALLSLLQANPLDAGLGVRKLGNVHPPAWRIRIGSFRLVYTFNQEQLILLRFRHRKDVYRNL